MADSRAAAESFHVFHRHMGPLRMLLVAAATATLGGCALLVPHRPAAKIPVDDPVLLACASATGVDPKHLVAPISADDPTAAAKLLERVSESAKRATDAPGGVDPYGIGVDICHGYTQAEGYRRAYFNAVRWHSGLRNTTAALAIPLAGLTLREGLESSPSSDKIADFGVATIVLYGWATALTSAPRQKVYLNGMQAMSCAMLEAQPIIVGATQLRALGVKVKEAEQAQAAFYGALSSAGIAELTRPQDAAYVKAIADSQNAIVRVHEFAIDLARAGGEYLPLVETIATQVGRNIVDTEPSPQSLLSLLNGFGAQTRAFTQTALPAKSSGALVTESGTPAVKADPEAIGKALAKLRATTDQLNALLAKVTTVASATSKLKACKPDSVANEFKVEPNEAVVVVEEEKERELTVTNKVSVPTAQLQGEKTDHVELLDTIVRGESFVVRVKGKKATGSAGPTLVITDGTGQQDKRIVVNVTAKTRAPADENQPSDAAGDTGGGATDNADTDVAITTQESELLTNAALAPENAPLSASVKVLQCVVDADVDGTVGSNTRAAIETFRKSEPAQRADGIDAALLAEVAEALRTTKQDCKEAS